MFVLINKMDLVAEQYDDPGKAEEGRKRVFEEKREELERRAEEVRPEGWEGKPIRCFGTSIWDESLYKVSGRSTSTPWKDECLSTSSCLTFRLTTLPYITCLYRLGHPQSIHSFPTVPSSPLI